MRDDPNSCGFMQVEGVNEGTAQAAYSTQLLGVARRRGGNIDGRVYG